MNQKNEQDFNKLLRIAKILFPVLLITSFVFYYVYQHSLDLVELNVADKSSKWASTCTENDCVEYQLFFVSSANETLSTSEVIFNEIEIGNTYLVSTQGWSFGRATRKLIKVH